MISRYLRRNVKVFLLEYGKCVFLTTLSMSNKLKKLDARTLLFLSYFYCAKMQGQNVAAQYLWGK